MSTVGLVLGNVVYLFGKPLLGLYSGSNEVSEARARLRPRFFVVLQYQNYLKRRGISILPKRSGI